MWVLGEGCAERGFSLDQRDEGVAEENGECYGYESDGVGEDVFDFARGTGDWAGGSMVVLAVVSTHRDHPSDTRGDVSSVTKICCALPRE